MSDSTTITAEQAKIILQFLQRTQLSGSEMPAFVAVFNSLSAIAQDSADEQAMPAN